MTIINLYELESRYWNDTIRLESSLQRDVLDKITFNLYSSIRWLLATIFKFFHSFSNAIFGAAFWRSKYSQRRTNSIPSHSGSSNNLDDVESGRILEAKVVRAASSIHRFFRPRKKVGHEFFLRHYLPHPYTALPHNATLHHCPLPPHVCVPSNRSPLSTGLP